MFCSPTYLVIDRNLWGQPRFFDLMSRGLQNYTPGQPYDCGLKSAPCDSPLAQAIVFSDNWARFVYWFDLVVFYLGLTSFVVAGIFGNLANIVIFATTKIANDSTNMLLLATAVSDLFNCLVFVPYLIVNYLCFVDTAWALTGNNIYPLLSHIVNYWFCLLSLDLITILALQRAAAVVIPFRASIVFSYRKTKILIAGCVVVCLVTCIPFLFVRPVRWVLHPFFGKWVSLGFQDNDIVPYYTQLKYFHYYSNVRTGVDICILVIAVFVTIVKLVTQGKTRAGLKETPTSTTTTTTTTTNIKSNVYQQNQNNYHISNNNNNNNSTMIAPSVPNSNSNPKSSKGGGGGSNMSERESKAMKMSLAVCVTTFVVTSVMILTTSLLRPRLTSIHSSPLPAFFVHIMNLIMTAFTAFNFFLYLILSPHFRQAFRNLFTRSRPGKPL